MAYWGERRVALPVLTTLIGSGGFVIGVWSFLSPASGARAFGGYMNRIINEPTTSATNLDASKGSSIVTDNTPYLFPHAIRNLGQGLSILALTGYWQLSSRCRNSPLTRVAVQRCLGIVVTVGALTPIVDAYVNFQTARLREGDADRHAAWLHVSRTGIWLVGGLWCLLG